MELPVFHILGISLGLGLLVGLQRERALSRTAGIRTYPLISLFGTVSAYLANSYGGWVVAAAMVCMAILLLVANLHKLKADTQPDPGLTTEVSVLLMFAIGAYLVVGSTAVAVVLGAAVAVLLHLKEPLHRFVEKMGEHDMRAIMQFAVISLIILPVLPNRTFGPYSVLNPYKIWLMVVLIVGIGLGGYVAYKLFGARAGSILGGVLGGMISSTATTVSYARRTQGNPGTASLGALVIMIASTIVYVRVLVEIAAVAPQAFGQLAPPIVVLLIFTTLLAGYMWFFARNEKSELPAQSNPAELRSALIFSALYAVVIVAVAFARDKFGDSGLYVVAIISGLTDVDAITLSTAGLVQKGSVDVTTGWRAIIVASLANLVFKAGAVGFLAHGALFSRILLLFGLTMVAGLLIVFFWPTDFSSDLFRLHQ